MKSLAERVKEHRQSLGMNPSDYARHVGTSRQNINNVEAGQAEQPRYIDKLAKAMGTTVDDLLGNHPAGAHAPDAHAAALTGTPAYLAELAAKMSPEQQERLVAIAEQLAAPHGDRLRIFFSLAERAETPTPKLPHHR